MSKIRGGLLLIFLICTVPVSGYADDFKLIPYARARVEYNDNIFFTRDLKLDDIITTLTPGLDIVNQTERLFFGLYGHLDFLIYDDLKDLNNTDQFYSGAFSYQFSELNSFFANGGYTKDSRPDRDIETTGQILSNNIRERIYGSLGGSIGFTEKAALGFSYAYEQNEWDTAALTDSRINAGNLGFTYHLGALLSRTILRLNLGFNDFNFDTSKTQTYAATIGFSRDHTELWSVQFDIGARYVESEFELLSGKETSDDWGGIGNLTFSYQGERTRLELSAGQDVRERAGQGGVIWQTSGVIFFSYYFIEDFSGRLNTSYFYNQAQEGKGSLTDIQEQTFTIRPGLRYDITRNLYIEAVYAHSWVDDIERDSIRTRNLVYGEVRWQVPILE